jgi:hypothetical protein
MEEYGLKVYEIEVLLGIFGPKKSKKEEDGVNCILKNFIIYSLHLIQLQLSNKGGLDVQFTHSAWEK